MSQQPGEHRLDKLAHSIFSSPTLRSRFGKHASGEEPDEAAWPHGMRLHASSIHFAGRVGGNQEFVLDRSDPAAASILKQEPDAAPWMSLRESLSLRGFTQLDIWKAGVIEGVGALGLDYITLMLGLSPSIDILPLPARDPVTGPFATSIFFGPLVGAVANVILISLYISALGPVSGGHINPLITMATFFARLTSLPRAIIYISFQMLGATMAGLLVRASNGSTHFKIGGCFRDPTLVTTQQAFAIEFTTAFALLFIAFGIGLDPRQSHVFPKAMPPILVGFAVGAFSLATSFAVPGYGGAGLNPARCFAAFVGSGGGLGVTGPSADGKFIARDGSWHWVHWIAPILASIGHGIFYFVLPPWGIVKEKAAKKGLEPAIVPSSDTISKV